MIEAESEQLMRKHAAAISEALEQAVGDRQLARNSRGLKSWTHNSVVLIALRHEGGNTGDRHVRTCD